MTTSAWEQNKRFITCLHYTYSSGQSIEHARRLQNGFMRKASGSKSGNSSSTRHARWLHQVWGTALVAEGWPMGNQWKLSVCACFETPHSKLRNSCCPPPSKAPTSFLSEQHWPPAPPSAGWAASRHTDQVSIKSVQSSLTQHLLSSCICWSSPTHGSQPHSEPFRKSNRFCWAVLLLNLVLFWPCWQIFASPDKCTISVIYINKLYQDNKYLMPGTIHATCSTCRDPIPGWHAPPPVHSDVALFC